MKRVVKGKSVRAEDLNAALDFIRKHALAAIEDGRDIEIVVDVGHREVSDAVRGPSTVTQYQRTGGVSFRIEVQPLPEGQLDQMAEAQLVDRVTP